MEPLEFPTVRVSHVLFLCCLHSEPPQPARPQDGLHTDPLPSREPALRGVPGPTEPWPVRSHAGAGHPRGGWVVSVTCGRLAVSQLMIMSDTLFFSNCFCN